jgi:hypothetical protein
MPAHVYLIDAATGQALHTEDYPLYGADDKILAVIVPQKVHGVFKTAAYTVQGTFQQITPVGNGSIELTDMIITFEKKNTGVVTVNLHDGTNTAPIVKVTLTDASCNLAINFSGRWKGWAAAHIDVVISGADSIGTVAIGYVHHDAANSLTYSEWNSLR